MGGEHHSGRRQHIGYHRVIVVYTGPQPLAVTETVAQESA
jgi:hypothetical protein